MYVHHLPERRVAGRRLGRHIEHDPRSRAFAVPEPPRGLCWFSPIQTVAWTRRAPIFDQGDIGACTGNAMAGALATDSSGREGDATIDEVYALELYHLATELDDITGIYPPDDTGSSGLAAAKAAKKLGRLSSYRHAFSARAALAALQDGPLIVGVTWLTGCDEPDETGRVRYAGYPRGGHEICAVGVDARAKTVTFANSWGSSWGLEGYFSMSWTDFATALRHGGDVTVPAYS